MLLTELVNGLKYNIQSGSASDDRRFSDKYLEHVISIALSSIIKEKKKKKEVINDYYYTYVCASLVDQKINNCNCDDKSCLFKQTSIKLPEYFDLEVLNLNGEVLSKTTLDVSKYSKYALNKNKTPQWTVLDNKLIFVNAKYLEKVLIKILCIEEISNMENCINDELTLDTSSACIFVNKKNKIPLEDVEFIYQKSKEIIFGKKYMIQDTSNNLKDETILDAERIK